MAETATAPAPKKRPVGKFADLMKPAFVVSRPHRARPFVLAEAELPPAGQQFFLRRGVGHGWVDKGEGYVEVRNKSARIKQTLVYAAWLEGHTVERIARDYGWSQHSVSTALQAAKREMTTLAVVQDALAKLDRVAVPAAVDVILESLVVKRNVDVALKLLAGRQLLVSRGIAGDTGEPAPKGSDGNAAPVQNNYGLIVNIVEGSSASKPVLGEIVGVPYTVDAPAADLPATPGE